MTDSLRTFDRNDLFQVSVCRLLRSSRDLNKIFEDSLNKLTFSRLKHFSEPNSKKKRAKLSQYEPKV